MNTALLQCCAEIKPKFVKNKDVPEFGFVECMKCRGRTRLFRDIEAGRELAAEDWNRRFV